MGCSVGRCFCHKVHTEDHATQVLAKIALSLDETKLLRTCVYVVR